MSLRRLITVPAKWALARVGWDVIRRDRYGYDPYLDIQRLSEVWGYEVRLFFDVGANEGQTVLAARARFPGCRIVTFEPHPKTFLNLKRNIQEVGNVQAVNTALGTEIGKVTMFDYGEASGLNSLIPDAPYVVRLNKKANEITVNCTTRDAFCEENGISKIDVLKIDTEGFDLQVLKGARSMLESGSIDFIYFEITSIHAEKGGLGPIDSLINPLGYKFIATYNDCIHTMFKPHGVSNALYALPPA